MRPRDWTESGALQSNPAADVVATGVAFIDGRGAPVANEWYRSALDFYNQKNNLAVALINGNFVMSTSNLVFRRTLLERIGLFAPLRYAHDLEFLLRALARAAVRAAAGGKAAQLPGASRQYDKRGARRRSDRMGCCRGRISRCAATRLKPLAWDQLAMLEQVLERHALARGVHLCLAWLRRDPDGLKSGQMLSDPSFRRVLQSAVAA